MVSNVNDQPEKARVEPQITRNFYAFFSHLKSLDISPDVCIDVGAAHGTPSIYHAFPEALHVAFEPLPEFIERLKETLTPYKHEIHNCALMETAAEAKLLRTGNLYSSSMMHVREDSAEALLDVEVATLDDKMSAHDLSGTLLIKTDCQGADLSVIKGGMKTLEQADIVIMEVSFFKFWGSHQPDFYEVVDFMKAQGFVVYDLLDGLLRPLDGALGQIDVAFVKEKGPLRRRTTW